MAEQYGRARYNQQITCLFAWWRKHNKARESGVKGKPGHPGRPPNFFGAYNWMEILISIAVHKCVRRQDLRMAWPSAVREPLEICDKSGLLIRWRLKNGRGLAFSLNPRFALAKHAYALLIALAHEYPTIVRSDITAYEDMIPSRMPQRSSNPELLFGSGLRTHTLAALESMRGTAPLSKLCHVVHGEFFSSVKTLVKVLVQDGILENKAGTVSFADRQWTGALRALLRAYLKQNPGFKTAVASARRLRNASRSDRYRLGLLGAGSMERTMIALATQGPMPYARALACAVGRPDGSLARLESDGLVTSVRNGQSRIVGLNASHPLYRELNRLLVVLSDGQETRPKALRVSRNAPEDYGVESLFSKSLRFDVLLMLATCSDGELDASSLARLLPEYDYGKILKRLRGFEKSGIVVSRRWKTVILFQLNPEYRAYSPLRRLLRAIAKWRPEYVAALAVEEQMYSSPLKSRVQPARRSTAKG